jgi:hypothetical protein
LPGAEASAAPGFGVSGIAKVLKGRRRLELKGGGGHARPDAGHMSEKLCRRFQDYGQRIVRDRIPGLRSTVSLRDEQFRSDLSFRVTPRLGLRRREPCGSRGVGAWLINVIASNQGLVLRALR